MTRVPVQTARGEDPGTKSKRRCGDSESTGDAGDLDLLLLSPQPFFLLRVKRSPCLITSQVCVSHASAYPASHFEPLLIWRATLGLTDTAVRS